MTTTYAFQLSENGGRTFRQIATGIGEAARDEHIKSVMATQEGLGKEPALVDDKPGVIEIRLGKIERFDNFAWRWIDENEEQA